MTGRIITNVNIENIVFHLKSFVSFFIDEDKLIFKEGEVVNSLNGFFSNIVKNLEIAAYNVGDTLHHKLSNHPTLQVIRKYRNHPNIDTIQRHFKYNANFYFRKIEKVLFSNNFKT